MSGMAWLSLQHIVAWFARHDLRIDKRNRRKAERAS